MAMIVISIVVGVGVIVASIAVMVQTVVHRFRSRPGNVAHTRAGRITFLLAAAVSLTAALVFAVGPSGHNPDMAFLVGFAVSGLLLAAALLIWAVVEPVRAIGPRNTLQSPTNQARGHDEENGETVGETR